MASGASCGGLISFVHLVGGSSIPNGIRSRWDQARVGSVAYGAIVGGHAKCHGTRHARSMGTSMARVMETLTACHENRPTAWHGKPHGSTAVSRGLPWSLPWHATNLSNNKQCAPVYFESQFSYVQSSSSMTKLPASATIFIHQETKDGEVLLRSSTAVCACAITTYVIAAFDIRQLTPNYLALFSRGTAACI